MDARIKSAHDGKDRGGGLFFPTIRDEQNKEGAARKRLPL